MSKVSSAPSPKKKLRALEPPGWLPGPVGCSIRTRIKGSPRDFEVLQAIGDYLGHLANLDLVWVRDKIDPKERKTRLTRLANARWANGIMGETDRRIHSEQINRWRAIHSLDRAIACIDNRLTAQAGDSRLKPYKNARVAGLKIIRRQNLIDRRDKLKREPVSIVRGGHRLWEMRHNLKEADLTLPEWWERWRAARMFLSARGSRDEGFGNCTIQVYPKTGVCSIALPAYLAKTYANSSDGRRYVLDARLDFTYRHDEWLERARPSAKEARAITYTVSHHPESRGRWYLDAAWAYKDEAPTVHPQLKRRLGVDFNADHLAAWLIDESGNPVGSPYRIPLIVKGLSVSARDGHMGWAISQLLKLALRLKADIACENLGWADETGRDDQIAGRVFRQTCSGFPTAKFKDRLQSMAHHAGVSIRIVDPAYTSQWGQAYWSNFPVTKHLTTPHEAAAIVIGRRSQSQSARRKPQDHRGQRARRVQSDLSSKALTQDQPALGKLWVQGPGSRGQPLEPKPRHTTLSPGRGRSLAPAVLQNCSALADVNLSGHLS